MAWEIEFFFKVNFPLTDLWKQLPDAGLSSKIPHLEFQIFVSDLLNIETNRWNGGHNFANL